MLDGNTILIVEDEALIAEHLKTILEQLNCASIEVVDTKEAAISTIDSLKPDITLLDINLAGHMEGIDIADYINTTCQLPFIFITAYADATTLNKALIKHPAAYITKPFKQADVIAAIQLVFLNNTKPKTAYFVFKSGEVTVRLNTTAITHIEATGNYIVIHTKEKKFTVRHSLSWALENLPVMSFIKVHRSFIVNIHHIQTFNSHELKVAQTIIPLSRLYKEDLQQKINVTKK
jgi:DNA-binding LytR/AlgR family response regulator